MASRGGGRGNSEWGVIALALLLLMFAANGHVPDLSEIITDAARGSSSGSSSSGASASAPATVVPDKAAVSSAKSELSSVKTVSVRTPVANYSRAQFGPAWTDDNSAPGGHNGCDTRNDMLKASLVNVTYVSGNCVVASGVLPYDPYTGQKNVKWSRGATTSSLLQIDHVVPLQWAWDNGASKWTAAQRLNYANDESTVLLLANGAQNGAKGSMGPSGWFVPDNAAFRCEYAVKFTSIVSKYGLTMPVADAKALESQLGSC